MSKKFARRARFTREVLLVLAAFLQVVKLVVEIFLGKAANCCHAAHQLHPQISVA
jgi:hypothetical protein